MRLPVTQEIASPNLARVAMKDIILPSEAENFEIQLRCTCGTRFTAEFEDLEIDIFKKPGTYWFDGSADAAGVDTRIYVACPECRRYVFPNPKEIPQLIWDRMKKKKRNV